MVNSAFLAMGLDSDAPQYEFPMEMFLTGSDLTPLEENAGQIINGLTRWKPRAERRTVDASVKLAVEGKDYYEVISKMNCVFLKSGWGDGLPVLPATEERVSLMLTGTDLGPDAVVGIIPPSGRAATVESLGVNLAMTGGRPEYMPVLIAAIKAFMAPQLRPELLQTTTCSAYPVAIVSGPVGKQIRLNSGYGCLGPHPAHPAGASIGRAIRLVQQNIGGAVPGSGSMSIYGGPARYTNIVFAEDESGLPPGWEPLSRERGFPAGANVVTLYNAASTTNINLLQASTLEVALESLTKFGRIMGSDYGNVFTNYGPDSVPGIVLMPRGFAGGLSALGWSKEKVKTFLWGNSKIPWSVVKADSIIYGRMEECTKGYVLPGDAWPLAVSPKNIMIVVAGGAHSNHGYWMRVGCCPVAPASVEIGLPANWAELLERAEQDLGPFPAV
ncbi:MAG: hypothetical protein HY673_24980 [Chloroflexi bacterium]|nr:hypothetical protein [Chloroflexota bacterium]